jgi:hypothetical protein
MLNQLMWILHVLLPQKQKQASGFSLGFGFGRKGSNSGGSSSGGMHFDGPALLSAGTLKSDDDMFVGGSSKDLIRR